MADKNETKPAKVKRSKVFSKRTLIFSWDELMHALTTVYPECFPFEGENLEKLDGGADATLYLVKESR